MRFLYLQATGDVALCDNLHSVPYFIITKRCLSHYIKVNNKSSAVAEMGDRGWPQQTWAEKSRAAMPLSRELGPRLIQCGLGRGLLPYQVASSSIQPFGHNRHGPKIGWGWVCLFSGGCWSPSNTKSPGLRPTSMPSVILIHPAVWP